MLAIIFAVISASLLCGCNSDYVTTPETSKASISAAQHKLNEFQSSNKSSQRAGSNVYNPFASLALYLLSYFSFPIGYKKPKAPIQYMIVLNGSLVYPAKGSKTIGPLALKTNGINSLDFGFTDSMCTFSTTISGGASVVTLPTQVNRMMDNPCQTLKFFNSQQGNSTTSFLADGLYVFAYADAVTCLEVTKLRGQITIKTVPAVSPIADSDAESQTALSPLNSIQTFLSAGNVFAKQAGSCISFSINTSTTPSSQLFSYVIYDCNKVPIFNGTTGGSYNASANIAAIQDMATNAKGQAVTIVTNNSNVSVQFAQPIQVASNTNTTLTQSVSMITIPIGMNYINGGYQTPFAPDYCQITPSFVPLQPPVVSGDPFVIAPARGRPGSTYTNTKYLQWVEEYYGEVRSDGSPQNAWRLTALSNGTNAARLPTLDASSFVYGDPTYIMSEISLQGILPAVNYTSQGVDLVFALRDTDGLVKNAIVSLNGFLAVNSTSDPSDPSTPLRYFDNYVFQYKPLSAYKVVTPPVQVSLNLSGLIDDSASPNPSVFVNLVWTRSGNGFVLSSPNLLTAFTQSGSYVDQIYAETDPVELTWFPSEVLYNTENGLTQYSWSFSNPGGFSFCTNFSTNLNISIN